ncbi:MAG TPA: Ig-like domain-containing protein [Trebonia sp.]|nr:Ig-like domain-containing protein [Trebonia sp.]
MAAAAVLIAFAGTAMAVTLTGPARADTTAPGGIWGAPQAVPGLAALVGSTVDPQQVNDIHCSSPGNCVAIGQYDPPSDTYGLPFVVSETNGIWGSVQSVSGITPDPAVGDSGMGSLTCTTATDFCIATGSVTGSDGVTHNFLLPETGGVWSTATIMDFSALPGATDGWIAALSCPAEDSCTATGYYDGPSGMLPFTMDETAGTWGQPQPVAGLDSLVTGTPTQVSSALWTLSCGDPGDCTAGGYYVAQGQGMNAEVPFTVTESGHTWGQAQAIPGLAKLSTGSAQIGIVNGVSCPDANDCTVAGITTSQDAAGTRSAQVFTLDESQGVWGTAQALALPSSATLGTEIPPEGPGGPALSCRAAGDCVLGIPATITAGTSTTNQYLTATEASSGNWTTATTIPGIAAGNDINVSGLNCASAGDCYVYGSTHPASSGTSTPFLATSSSASGFGSAQLIPNAPKTSGSLVMSCAQPGYCALADSSGLTVPQFMTEANTSEVISPSGFNETYGSEQSKPLTVSVNSPAGGTPTGTITILTGGTTLCTATLASGSASCTLSATQLQAGSYPLTVSYSGDGNYLPSTFNSSGGVSLTVRLPTEVPYTPVAPVRVLDTRDGTGGFSSPVGAGKTIALQVAGQDGVPAYGVTAVVLNLTATGATANGWVVAYPDGKARPAQGSSVNFTKGETIPNLVTVPVGSDGKVDLYNSAGSVNLVADLQGYYGATGTSQYAADGPVRVLDTRNDTGGFASPVGAGQSIALQVTGQDGVPASGVTAVVLNLTATGPTASSYVTAYPDGTARPAQGSNLNFTKGETIPNLVIVQVGADGKVDLYNNAGTVNLVADLQGYYTTTGGAGYAADGPVRVLDTRDGTGGFASPVGAGKAIALQVTGKDGVPASGVTAVVLNLTATGPTASGWVVAYPDGTARPAQGSNLNFTKGETIPNLVIVPVGADGKIDLYNSAGSVNLVADLQGYFAG